MLETWVKLLPYWLVMWLVRNYSSADGQGIIKFGSDEYTVSYYRVGSGEFVVYSQEVQDRYNERQKIKRDKKRNKKLDKINDALREDYFLKKDLIEQFENEKKNNEY